MGKVADNYTTEDSAVKAKREIWNYHNKSGVWAGKYRNSHNMPHWHTDCELLYIERGAIDIFCGNEAMTLTVGQACFVEPETIHYMHAQTPDTVIAVLIFSYGIIEGVTDDNVLEHPYIRRNYGIGEVYNVVKRELTDKQAHFEQMICDKIRDLFIVVMRNEATVQRKKENSTALMLRKLLDKINDDYAEITFEDACKFMALEPAYFSRYFRRYTGMSFSQYLTFTKVDNAVQQLKSGETSVTDVAVACGFDSIRTFNRNFKELTGYTPTELPHDYSMAEYFVHSDQTFNPTDKQTALIE